METTQKPQDEERLNLPSASQSCFWCCPGQNNLMRDAGYPEGESNPDAERGTKIHTAFETGNTLELDEEQEETYKQGLIFLDALLADWLANAAGDKWEEGERECRMWIRDQETLEPLASAKLDRHYISGDAGYAIDLKSGFVPNLAPSPRSTQLRIQALALKSEHPELRRIRVAFCKAKLRYGSDDYTDYTEQDLVHAETWMRNHLWLSKQPDASRTPGPHCTYCPCKAWCREAASYSMLPSVIASKAVNGAEFNVDLAVSQMTAPDLVKLWQSKSLVESILKAVVTRLKSMPDESLTALGITRGKGRENHDVTNTAEAVEILKLQGWTEEAIYACMEFSNTKLMKVARHEKGFQNDKAATSWIRLMLSGVITKTTSEQPLKQLDE